MTMRKIMERDGGNLGWCKPYKSEDGTIAFNVNEGSIESIQIDGEDVDTTPETIRTVAKRVNPDYDIYGGWDDEHIIFDGDVRECDCSSCPWFGVCCAMDDENEEDEEDEE